MIVSGFLIVIIKIVKKKNENYSNERSLSYYSRKATLRVSIYFTVLNFGIIVIHFHLILVDLRSNIVCTVRSPPAASIKEVKCKS